MVRATLNLSSSLLFLISFYVINIDALIRLPPNVTIPALIAFGDSIIDPGNNNDKLSVAKCNYPPYGKDFMGGIPTGRFTNGRNPTDLLVEELGLKNYLPAYLDPNLQPEELLTGVCFASGGAGFDPLTSTLGTAIPITEQVNMFKEYTGKLKAMVGQERTDFIISNSLYVVVFGSNDIANTYFGTPIRRAHYDVDSYVDLILSYASSFIKELYDLGARRIAVFGAPPLGCVPSQRTIQGGPYRMCVVDQENFSIVYNSKLSSLLQSLKSTLRDSRVVYIDIYYPLLDIILFPSKYGMEEVTRGCCGTGLIEFLFYGIYRGCTICISSSSSLLLARFPGSMPIHDVAENQARRALFPPSMNGSTAKAAHSLPSLARSVSDRLIRRGSLAVRIRSCLPWRRI